MFLKFLVDLKLFPALRVQECAVHHTKDKTENTPGSPFIPGAPSVSLYPEGPGCPLRPEGPSGPCGPGIPGSPFRPLAPGEAGIP